jgi:pyruvate,orthophosphate dikinase
MREMILAEDPEGRRRALAKLLPSQRRDFVELFEIMAGLPVTIRLLDPPLHEFLPHGDDVIAEVAAGMGVSVARLRRRIAALSEFNPMLGQRGSRLLVSHPEIVEMQARAIFEAAIEAGQALHDRVIPEIMVPLVVSKGELDLVKERIAGIARAVEKERGTNLAYSVGTMVELPRSCLMAGEIGESAEFFSFGTNDLTQTTFGLSRDDAGRFLGEYVDKGQGPTRPEDGHLRRAWRRSGDHPLLRDAGAELRLLLALPGARRPARGSPSRAWRAVTDP